MDEKQDGPVSQEELSAFVTASVEAFENARATAGEKLLALSIAKVRIDVRFAGSGLYDRMAAALAGCRTDDNRPADATLLAFDSESTGAAIPLPPRNALRFLAWRGDVWTDAEASAKLAFSYADYTVQTFDPERRTGIFMVDSHRALPFWSVAAPLRSLISMALEANGAQLVHGAAIGSEAGAILLTGHGGSGKSTTALSCLAMGVGFLGDDYVAIRPADDGSLPMVYNVFTSAKVGFEELERLDAFRDRVAPRESEDQPKAVIYPFSSDDRLLLREAPLVGCFSTLIGNGARTEIAPCELQRVARNAFTSTALQTPFSGRLARERIEASMVRPHELILGTDRSEVVHRLRGFLRDRKATIPPRPVTSNFRPRLSVVIPVHNGSRFLGDALENVHAQRYPSLEVIVVDDGSTDDIAAVSAGIALPHTLLRQMQSGPAGARNAGILAAKGELIAFLDVDDLWPAGNLDRLAMELSIQPEVDVVHGKLEVFELDPGSGQWRPSQDPRANFPFSIGAGLYRRSVFEKVGLFDRSLIYGEDSDWYLRAYEKANILMLPEVTMLVRNHDANMTRDKSAVKHSLLRMFKRYLDRKRDDEEGSPNAPRTGIFG